MNVAKHITGVLILGIMGGVGCAPNGSGADTRRPAEPDIGVVQADLDPRSLQLPLDRYQLTTDEQDVRSRARATLLDRCMRRFGFHLRLPVDSAEYGLNANRYGLTDLSAAAKLGYHPPEPRGKETEPIELDRAAEAVALGGPPTEYRGIQVPPGGCAGAADGELTRGAAQADSNLVEALSFLTLNRSEADSRVEALFASWSECMRRAGYHYRTPWESNDNPRFHTERPSMAEIATAKADVQCKQEVDLVPTWAAVDAAYQRVAIARNLRRLMEIEDDLRTMLMNARQTNRTAKGVAAEGGRSSAQ